jgi:MSHA biogenesis protein MshM
MYFAHFGLNQPPFGMTPNPSFFFAGSKRGEILEALTYAVVHGEGIIKVTGEVGSGKTMLCRMLESQLPGNIEVIYLVNPTLSREQVVYAIAGELDLATSGKRPDEVIRLLQSDLIGKHISGKQVVLLVEEAQAMPLETLEEIRLFSNLETAHHKLLQIVLFGQPELDENLDLPRMRQLKERITHSFRVPPLTPTVIPDYLMFRLRAAGYHGPDIFNPAAIQLIGRVSEGIVRRISILADKSLLAAFADNSYEIKAKHVKAAINDSEFPKTVLRTMDKKAAAAVLAILLLVIAGVGWRFFWVGTPKAVMPAIAPPLLPHTTASVQLPIAHLSFANQPSTLIQPSVSGAKSGGKLIDSVVTTSISDASAPSLAVANAQKGIVAESAAAPAALRVGITLQQRLQITNAWLNAQSPNRYSIQITLIASGDEAQVARFLRRIESESGLSGVYVYASRKASNVRFGIVYGSFATRAEALAKLGQLSGQWGSRPQLRTIGGIKKEIERSTMVD